MKPACCPFIGNTSSTVRAYGPCRAGEATSSNGFSTSSARTPQTALKSARRNRIFFMAAPVSVQDAGEGAPGQQLGHLRPLLHQLEQGVRDDFAQLRAALFVEQRMAGDVGEVKIPFQVVDGTLARYLGGLLYREAVQRRAATEQRLHARRQVGFEPQALLFFVSPVLKCVHKPPP